MEWQDILEEVKKNYIAVAIAIFAGVILYQHASLLNPTAFSSTQSLFGFGTAFDAISAGLLAGGWELIATIATVMLVLLITSPGAFFALCAVMLDIILAVYSLASGSWTIFLVVLVAELIILFLSGKKK